MSNKNSNIYDKIIGIQGDVGIGINDGSQIYNNQIDLDTCAYNNPNFVSKAQKLAGGPNPKTLIQPVIPAKSLDINYWKTNNLVENSAINSEKQRELYLNGYVVSTCCPSNSDSYSVPVNNKNIIKVPVNRPVKKKYSHLEDAIKSRVTDEATKPPNCLVDPRIEVSAENFDLSVNKLVDDKKHQIELEKKQLDTVEIPESGELIVKDEEVDEIIITPNQEGWVNTNCGYNPEQLITSNLPTNLPVGNCPRDEQLATYNKNLFTQTIQPNVYTRSEIIEPINNNIGISFDQQLLPTTVDVNPISGDYNFTEHDPRIIEPSTFTEITPPSVIPNEYNIYDPRFTGAGTSYRSYTDKMLGQPKYYYGDIDAVKMPNYITRNNIDNQPYADSYGPIKPGDEFGNHNTADIRKFANQSFLDSTIAFRTEMMQRLMRKNNAAAWQRRKHPIHKMSC